MCGIAGIIYRNGTHEIGRDMTRMLQSMKHRGPDSTGYALYGPPNGSLVMRYKLADANDPRDFEFHDRLARNKRIVDQRLRNHGATIQEVEAATEYAYRVAFEYDGDLKELTDLIEDVQGAEVLSLGHSLEIVKDLGDAEEVSDQYDLGGFSGTHAIGHVRMSLEEAMRQSLEDLDGVFTYIAVTEDALGVAKDEMAAKPLVLYESDDVVALASEEIAIRSVIDREIDTYDPYEREVLVWQR